MQPLLVTYILFTVTPIKKSPICDSSCTKTSSKSPWYLFSHAGSKDMSQEKPDVSARKGPLWQWDTERTCANMHSRSLRHMSWHTQPQTRGPRWWCRVRRERGWKVNRWRSTGEAAKRLATRLQLKKTEVVPSQPRSICPLRWRASLMRSGRRPFKSTDARQPWKPSREATSFGRLLYMPWARPAM